MDMIERVAKAMADEQGSNWSALNANGPGSGLRNMYLRLASVAIKAMKDPTFDMLVAGKAANAGPRSSLHGYIYEAMIEAAMKESA